MKMQMLGDDTTLGSWEMPQEMVMLRDTARRFMLEKVIPEEDKVEHDAFTLPQAVLSWCGCAQARLQGR